MNKIAKITSVTAALAIMLPTITFAETSLPVATLATTSSASTTLKVNKPRELSGKITAINGSSLTMLAVNGGTYTVNAGAAKLVRRYGAAMAMGDFQVNDMVAVKGTVSQNTITASLIRDNSLQARNGTFTGTVKSINGTSFVLHTNGRADQTINTTPSTTFKMNGKTASMSDLIVGRTVVVSGVWDRPNTNVTAKSVTVKIIMKTITVAGTVNSVSSSTMSVAAANSTTYNIDLSKARFVRKNYGRSNVGEVKVGDSVRVSGKHETFSNNIAASLVRDLSVTSTKK